MKTKTVSLIGFCFLCFAAAFLQAQAKPAFSLDVIHVNDTHKMYEPVHTLFSLALDGESAERSGFLEIGGFERTIDVIRRMRASSANPLVLNGGDYLERKFETYSYTTAADAAVWNLAGFDAGALGNNEMADGLEGYLAWRKLINWPLLAVNLGDAYARRMGEGYPAASLVKEYGKERVGIIGCPSAAVDLAAPAVQAEIDALEAKGIDKIVIVSHLGLDNDIALAAKLRGADLIVGGHSHSLQGSFQMLSLPGKGEYPAEAKGADGGRVLVVQAYEYGKVVGRLRVDFDAQGRISGWDGAPVVVLSGEWFRLNELPDAEGKPVNVEFTRTPEGTRVRIQRDAGFLPATAAERDLFLPLLDKLVDALSKRKEFAFSSGDSEARRIVPPTPR